MAVRRHGWGVMTPLLLLLIATTILHEASAFLQPVYHNHHNNYQLSAASSQRRLQAAESHHNYYNDTSSLKKTSLDSSSSSTSSRRGGHDLSRGHVMRSAAAAAFLLTPWLSGSGAPLVTKPVQAAMSSGVSGTSSSSLVSSVGLLADVLPESVLVASLPLKLEGFRAIGTALNRLNDLRRLQFQKGQKICKNGEVSLPFEPAELVVATAKVGEDGTALVEEEEGANVSSFRWGAFRRIAEEVRTVFDKEKDIFRYALTIRANSSAESQQRRRQRFDMQLRLLDGAISKLINATKNENTTQTLQSQATCLLHLGHLGELMVAKFPFSPPKTDDRNSDDYYNLPRLFGRAEVDVILREQSSKKGQNGSPLKNFTLIVDGFNAPISAGNFVDLCQRGFYLDLPLRIGNVSTSREGDSLNVTIAGTYKDGFVDPIKGKERRVPLEVMRAEQEGTVPFYGQARNTKLFTRAPPLLSYRTPGAVGLYHPEVDGNGANSEFFWLSDDARCTDQAAGMLDGRYTLIGYFVGEHGGLSSLTEDYVVEATNIRWGLDHFVRSRVSFIDILLQGDE